MGGPRGTVEERFWRKVDKRGPDECWEWTASRHRFGYGRMGTTGPMVETAHRLSWRIHNGPVPPGMHVLHRCDNPPCVNPNHLFLGDQAANAKDMWSKHRGSQPPRMLKWPDDVLITAIKLYRAGGWTDRALGKRFGFNFAYFTRVRNGQIRPELLAKVLADEAGTLGRMT